MNRELFARQQMLKQKFRSFTKYTSDAARNLDYALDLSVDDYSGSSTSSPHQSQVHSVVGTDAATTATTASIPSHNHNQSQNLCTSHDESVDRFVHFILHAIKGHARSLCFSGRATADGGPFGLAASSTNFSPSTVTSTSTPTPSAERPAGEAAGRARIRSAEPKRADPEAAQPFIGPMPRPASHGAGSISFSEICSGDFVLDDILHHSHRFQLAFSDTYRSSTGEFGIKISTLCSYFMYKLVDY